MMRWKGVLIVVCVCVCVCLFFIFYFFGLSLPTSSLQSMHVWALTFWMMMLGGKVDGL